MESGQPPINAPSSPAADGPPKPSRGPLAGEIAIAIVVVAVLAGVVWGLPALTNRNPSPAPSVGPVDSPVAILPSSITSIAPSSAPSAPAPRPSPTQVPGGPFASSGSMVVEGGDGSLRVVDASGRSVVLEPASDASHLFPTWSPDGSRIAVIRYGTGVTEILVYDAVKAAQGGTEPVEPS
jgi:hypothetical protein